MQIRFLIVWASFHALAAMADETCASKTDGSVCANGPAGIMDVFDVDGGSSMLALKAINTKALAEKTTSDGDGDGEEGEFGAGKSLAEKATGDGDGDGGEGEFGAGKSLAEKASGDNDGDDDEGEFGAGKSLAEKTSYAKANSSRPQAELLSTYCGCNSRKCIEDWWPWSGVQYPYPWPQSLPSWSGGWWGRASNCDLASLSLAQKIDAGEDVNDESDGDGSLAQFFATGNVSLASAVKNGKHESPYSYAELLHTYCGCHSRKCIEDWWPWSGVGFPFPWHHLTYWSGGWWGRTSMCN